MDITIYPGKLNGTVNAIPSKSQAHRLLICAAFADRETVIHCPETSKDIEATAYCLSAMGAQIQRTELGYIVSPAKNIPTSAALLCGESGSTLRFLLPIAGALGIDATFYMDGRLPQRPLSPLWEEMERMGCALSRPTANTIRCTGKLAPGFYNIAGDISSQYITGLLFALALIPGNSTLNIIGKLESKPYVTMTLNALTQFGIQIDNWIVHGSFPFHSTGKVHVEGDWSNAAFFIAANALGSNINITGLDTRSLQGDKAIISCLSALHEYTTISAEDIPDLVPVLAVAAGAIRGATFTGIKRLRLKESDRVETTASMLRNFGSMVDTSDWEIHVHPCRFGSCTVDAAGDHRIAMAAAIGATVSTGPVTILGVECVSKSYPSFWEEFKKLGGQYEQYIR